MPLYTGIVGRPAGQIVPLVSTTKRSKQVALTITGTNWTTDRAIAIFSADSNGIWRMTFNIIGTISPGTTSISLAIAGIVFKAGNESQPGAVCGGSAPYHGSAIAVQNTGNLLLSFVTSGTNVGASGDVELNAEPTWASLGTTWAQVAEAPGDVTAYIPPADASTVGLVSIANQTFGGRKSAGNSKVRASLTPTTTSIPASTETEIVFNNDSAAGINCDINGEFNTSTGKFTATRAGWYLATVTLQMAAITSGKYWAVNLYKNGTGGFRFSPALEVSSSASDLSINATGLVYLNGTTDYISAFVYHNDTASANLYGHVSHNSSHIVIIELV